VFVCASTECFPGISLSEACGRLVDIEYAAVEVTLHEHGGVLRPSEVQANPEACYDRRRRPRL
jgi:hypothetical protein